MIRTNFASLTDGEVFRFPGGSCYFVRLNQWDFKVVRWDKLASDRIHHPDSIFGLEVMRFDPPMMEQGQ